MQNKTKILVFIDWFLPAFKAGGPVRSIANIVDALGDDHDFYIVTGNKEFGESSPMKEVSSNQWSKYGKANVIYLSDDNLTKKKYKEIYNEIKPDLIYLNSLFSVKFTLLPLLTFRNIKNKKRVVLAPRGMFGAESLKIKSSKKKVFLFITKFLKVFKNVIWHSSSEIEKKEIINKMGSSAKVRIARNIPFLPSLKESNITKEAGSINLISVGRIVPIKNILFKLKCLQNIDKNIKVSVKFIGPMEDLEYYEKCKTEVSKLSDNISVEFLGELQHKEIEKHYNAADVYISATLNENFGHGIAEAFGYGCPVIISDKTPWRALDKSGVGFDLELEQNKFIEKIEFFANMDAKAFSTYKLSARKYAENLFHKSGILAENKKLFQID